MIFTISLIVISALLLLIIGINLYQQHKEKQNADRRVQHQQQRAKIDETAKVLEHISLFPCSNQIMIVLYKRLVDEMNTAASVAPNSLKKDYERQLIDFEAQINQLESSPSSPPSLDGIQIPNDDKQLVLMVQVLKKLKAILRSEHNKGKIDPTVFTNEDNRINSMQLRINVDTMLSRAQKAKDIKQYGSAKQMLNKALATLNSIKLNNPDDHFVQSKLNLAQSISASIDNSQQQKAIESIPTAKAANGEDDIDVLFQPKKKW
ncbi:hypothetical protein D5018_10695 [Parashewanella curva]|uniref:DNA repair protein n=1 Tax=Parashewanella curva TaxID=2338552 RepID=A0A3L8PWP6_9GAMM|nr:hypothetical protein [Parashewanella curva]RLV59721.1 hypothetical protein D5018_10695 [Parashewanella curva]